MKRSIQESLRRLQTDAVDLLWLHASRDDVQVLRNTDAVEAMIEAKRAGMTRFIGLSGYTAEGFRAARAWCDAVMVAYHAEDVALAGIMREAASDGVVVIVKKGLASGRLSAAEAIRFVLGNGDVTSVVVGSLDLHHMEENLRAAQHARPDWQPAPIDSSAAMKRHHKDGG
jgi:aryl-alcohol dehydrogenase-like predicted oxidoreductase